MGATGPPGWQTLTPRLCAPPPVTDPAPDPAPSSAPESRPATLVLAVLGGIASGKSAAAGALAGADGTVVAADALAHEVLAQDEVAALVGEHFGPEALGPDGRPDRATLARVVFADPERRRILEGWIHPRVRATIRARLDEARLRGVPVVVLDVPLLLENDSESRLASECDALVFVDAPAAERDRRAVRDRGWSPGDVARRERAQLPLEAKRARADHVLANDGTTEALLGAAEALRAELLASKR